MQNNKSMWNNAFEITCRNYYILFWTSLCLIQGELFVCIITYTLSRTQFVDTGVFGNVFQLIEELEREVLN